MTVKANEIQNKPMKFKYEYQLLTNKRYRDKYFYKTSRQLM